MIEAQGGDPGVVNDPSRLPTTDQVVEVAAEQAGVVQSIDALEIGLTAVSMGAGRTRADQEVDHAVGIELGCAVGDSVAAGQPLAWLHVHRREDAAAPAARVRQALKLDESPIARPSPLIGRVQA
jgi:thymidine phosphorylase